MSFSFFSFTLLPSFLPPPLPQEGFHDLRQATEDRYQDFRSDFKKEEQEAAAAAVAAAVAAAAAAAADAAADAAAEAAADAAAEAAAAAVTGKRRRQQWMMLSACLLCLWVVSFLVLALAGGEGASEGARGAGGIGGGMEATQCNLTGSGGGRGFSFWGGKAPDVSLQQFPSSSFLFPSLLLMPRPHPLPPSPPIPEITF